jgi:hypothetical protein
MNFVINLSKNTRLTTYGKQLFSHLHSVSLGFKFLKLRLTSADSEYFNYVDSQFKQQLEEGALAFKQE